MNKKTITLLAGMLALTSVTLYFALMAWRTQPTLEPAAERMAVNEVQYREMVSAYPIAGEVGRDHPMHIFWEERRDTLIRTGYIETRQFPLKQRPDIKWSARDFYHGFQTRFPGVECSIEFHKADQSRVAIVTARKSDFESIQNFLTGYDREKK
jgi:hypothetical protein